MTTIERDTGFSGPVRLVQTGDVEWAYAADLTYTCLDGRRVLCREGTGTDGASVPRLVAWLVPRSGRYLPAACAHDEAYRNLVPEGLMSFQQADRMLREAMRRLGVPALQRAVIFAAVRLAGLFRPGGRRGWWRDAASVLPVALLALVVVVPVSAVVAVGLAVWWLLEQVVYLVLLVAGRRDRYVNRPRDLARS